MINSKVINNTVISKRRTNASLTKSCGWLLIACASMLFSCTHVSSTHTPSTHIPSKQAPSPNSSFINSSSTNATASDSYQAPSRQAQPKIGVQLHSVRDAISEDFENTLIQIADMGFDGVEFAGRYGPYNEDPKGLKTFLQSIGLELSGAHISLKQLRGERGDKHLRFFETLGVKLLIIPYDERANQPQHIDALITELAETAERAKQRGMQLGYHNHSSEFEAFGKGTFWDYLAQNTSDDFVLQLDVGWVKFAGLDPIDYIKRYPQRTLTTHYKIRSYKGKPSSVPAGTKVILGQNDYDWPALIRATTEYGGTDWIIIEQEEYPEPLTPIQSVKASLNGLTQVLRDMAVE